MLLIARPVAIGFVAIMGLWCSTAALAECTERPANMVAWWPGEGSAEDIWGGYDGTPQNGVAYTAGMVGQAFQLDGINDFVETPLSGNMLPLTIVAWARVGDQTSGEQSIVDSDIRQQHGHSLILGYKNFDDTFDVQYHDGYLDSGVTAVANTWFHLAAVYSETVQAYVNGSLVAEIPYSPPTLDGSDFRFGRHNSADPQWFEGLVDEVQIFDRALDPAEILAIYEAGPDGVCRCIDNDGDGYGTLLPTWTSATTSQDT